MSVIELISVADIFLVKRIPLEENKIYEEF